MSSRTTTATSPRSDVAAHAQTAAQVMLAALATQDFAGLAGALAPDVVLRALLPGGAREWSGADAVGRRFEGWFGETQAYALVDGVTGAVDERLHLAWRIRLRAERLGTQWFTVEQQCYADVDAAGRITCLDVLCTGFLPDGDV